MDPRVHGAFLATLCQGALTPRGAVSRDHLWESLGGVLNATKEVALETHEPSPQSMQLALRLAAVIDNMRAEGRFNLETWLNAVEIGMGGTVVVKAPCVSQKRAVPEARYVSEGISVSAQGTMFEQ